TLISALYPYVSQGLACDHHSYPASIRTLKEPRGARCTLGFDLKPGPITSVTGPGWLGAAICLAISRDLAITRSHPNKASGCRCCKPSDNESASASSKDLLFTGFLSFRDWVG